MDLARMKNSANYRAQLVAQFAVTLAAAFDCEWFDLIIAAAAGQKDKVIEADLLNDHANDADQSRLYFWAADQATEIETTFTNYHLGVNRSEIMWLCPQLSSPGLLKHWWEHKSLLKIP